MLPDYLCHYYECTQGPFRSLSDLPLEMAETVLDVLRQGGVGFASQRQADYLRIRRKLESQVRKRFIEKGGEPLRARPHYMILGQCAWLKSWYRTGCELCIPSGRFRRETGQFHLW